MKKRKALVPLLALLPLKKAVIFRKLKMIYNMKK